MIQPQSSDAILGNQTPPPINSAVLGGFVGLEHRFNQLGLGVEQKLATLAEVSIYGKAALPLIEHGLEDADLRVRWAAYLQLLNIDPNASAAKRGILLNIGDRIYAVYKSLVYDDDHASCSYISGKSLREYTEDFLFYHSKEDVQYLTFTYNYSDTSGDHYYYNGSIIIAYYCDYFDAESRVQDIFQQNLDEIGYEIHEIYLYSSGIQTSEFDLRGWVNLHQISLNKVFWNEWGEAREHDWVYEKVVLASLYSQNRFDLLLEYWHLKGYSPLSFIDECIIDRPCYLRLKELESKYTNSSLSAAFTTS